MTVLFKSEESRGRVLEGYEHFLARVESLAPGKVEGREVSTRFGVTHVLVGGPEDGPAVVVLPGALASSAHVLLEVAGLLEEFRVYAVDVIGQSVKSADVRLSVTNNDYGEWLSEVMAGLSLERAHVMGVSWGGFVATRLAVVAPEKVESLSLMVPAGVVKTPFMNSVKVGLPMTMFMMSESEERTRKFLATQLTTVDDADWAPYLAMAFKAYNLSMKVPALATVEELKGFDAPVFVVAAERDLSFPGEKVLARAGELFSNLQKTELLKGSSHCPPTTDGFREWFCGQMAGFLRSVGRA